MWSPLQLYSSRVENGKRVGIVGMGGLGHVGIRIAVAMGAQVNVFSTSPSKESDAKRLGAHHFVVSTDKAAMKSVIGSFDLILDTVSSNHSVASYIEALSPLGVFVFLGGEFEHIDVSAMNLKMGNKIVTGSASGGPKQTQDMLDFCAKKGIVSDIEIVNASQINEAFERTLKNDVKYRFVIDMKTL